MADDKLIEQINELAERVAQSYGLEVVHCEFVGERRNSILRVFIDKPGGVTHEDCAHVSNELSVILDVEDLIPHRYTLEVSSPGLDRGLYKRADYERFAGSLVRVRLAEPLEGRRNFKGRLQGLSDEVAVIVDETGQEFRLPVAQIAKANIEPEF